MTPLTFIVASLAVWRLSYILVRENGPLMVFARLRARLGASQKRSGGLFDMISCVRCISVWIGLVGALFVAGNVLQWLAYGLGFSAVASLIDLFFAKKPNTLSIVAPPATDNKISVGRSSTPIQRNDVIRHPDSTYGAVAVKAETLLDN